MSNKEESFEPVSDTIDSSINKNNHFFAITIDE